VHFYKGLSDIAQIRFETVALTFRYVNGKTPPGFLRSGTT
jgi:hypothetical protein